MSRNGIWALMPVKEVAQAKQRLSPLLPAWARRTLALAMIQDVLDALAATPALAGLAVVTADPEVVRIASRYRAEVFDTGARGGHTAAVAAGARELMARGRGGMLTLPGDIPLVSADEVARIVAAHAEAPAFTIVPARDEQGSNAILCSPPDAVPLRFGDDSFFPHLEAARRRGLRPTIVPMPGIGLDIDRPEDIAAFLRVPSRTRTRALLEELGFSSPEAVSTAQEEARP